MITIQCDDEFISTLVKTIPDEALGNYEKLQSILRSRLLHPQPNEYASDEKPMDAAEKFIKIFGTSLK